MKNGRKIAVCIFSLLLICTALVGIFSCGPSCEHQWQEATCTAPKTCLFCGETEGEKASHTGGTATCEKKAECSVCGAEHGELGEHAWVDATCTKPKHCTVCGKTEGDVISHTVGTAATCMKKAVCSVCNQEFGELGAHVYNADVVKAEAKRSDATCTDPATYYKSCACGDISRNAGEIFTSGDTLPHTYNENAVKPEAIKTPASCSEPATYYKSCSCGAVSTSDNETFTSGIADPHRFVVEDVKPEAAKQGGEATCKSAAIYYKSCACGEISESEADTFTYGDPLPHIFELEIAEEFTKKSDATCTEPAIYYKSCACGEIATSNDDTFTNGTAKGHSHELDSTTPATCTTPAVNHYLCACGDSYSNNVGSELGHNIVGVTPEKRHIDGCKYVYVYICKADGCGAEVVGATVVEHVYKATLTKEANCKEEGEKTLKCTCGDTKTEKIPVDTVNGHEWVKGSVTGNVRTDTCKHCGETKEVTVLSAPTSADSLKGGEVQVSGGDGEGKVDIGLKFDDGVIDKIKETTTENVTVSAGAIGSDTLENLLTPEQLEQIGGDTVYDFSISYGENDKVSTFGKDNYVTITLPYELAENEDVDSIAVWFINDNGELESIPATYNNGYVTFKTNHFSYYTVTRLNPEERCAIYGHSIVKQTVEGSCTEDAYTLEVCVRCHKTEKVVTKVAEGHDFETETHDATCTEHGYVEHNCKNCDYSYNTKIAATGHSFGVVETVEATCVENGYIKYGCANCDKEYSITLAKASHDYARTVVRPTCETYGYTVFECKNCKHTYNDKFVAELGHKYEAKGWTWASDYSSASFKLVCKHDETHVLEGDEFANVNSSKTVTYGKCSDFTKTVYTVSIYYNGVMYSDEKKVEVGNPDHVFSAEWKFDGAAHWHECVCGERADVVSHAFKNEKVTKAATCSEAGEKTAYCDCGAMKKTSVPPTGKHNYDGGSCTACGQKRSESFYVNLANSFKDADGFVLQIENLNLEFSETEHGLLGEIKNIGKIKQLSVAQLAIYVEDGKLKGAAAGSLEVFNGPIKDDYATLDFKAVIKDDIIYVLAEQTIGGKTQETELKYSFDWLLMKAFEMEPENARAIVDFFMDTALPTLDSLINNDPEKLEDITEDLMNMIFTTERQDDGTYLVTLDYDKLHKLNENLATLTVSQLIDHYFGRGTSDELVDLAFEVLGLTVSEIPDYLVSKGVDFDYVISQVNALAIMMGESPDFDASEFFFDDDYANIVLGDAIFEELFYGKNDKPGAYVKMVEDFITMLRENSLYYIITEDVEDAEDIKDTVASIIDMVKDSAYLTLLTDSTGTITEIGFGVNVEDLEVEEATFSLVFDLKLKLSARIDVTWANIIEKIESDVIPPTEEDIYEDTFEDVYHYYSYTEYKGKYYNARIIENLICKINYERVLSLLIEESCTGWKRYYLEYAIESYGYDIKYLYADEYMSSVAYMLIVNRATGETVECVPISDTLVLANYADGTKKEIDLTKLPEDYAEFYAAFFGAPVWITEEDTYSCRYYYNEAKGIYSENDPHSYVYDYVLHGKTCEDGCDVTITCENCDYHDEYSTNYCNTYSDMKMLSEYGFCGGNSHVSFAKCRVCGNTEHFSLNAFDCKFDKPITEDILDDDGNVIGESVTRICSSCGLKHVLSEWLEYTTVCEYVIYSENIIYDKDGKVVFEFLGVKKGNNHDFEYVMEEGKTCKEEHLVTRFCTVCDKTETFEYWGHYEIYENGNTADLGMCYGDYNKSYCALCGEEFYSNISCYGCNWEHMGETEDGYDRYVCRNCGAERLNFESYGEKEEGCRVHYSSTNIYNVNGVEVFRKQDSYYMSAHTYEYEYVLQGDSCEDGYTVIETCTDCNYRSERTNYCHDRYNYAPIDLQKYGVCYGSVSVYSCACGEYQGANMYTCGTYTHNEYEENGFWVEEETHVCTTCGLRITKRTYSETNSENCTLTTYYALTISIKGELILDEVYSLNKKYHDCEITGTLIGGQGSTCEDGVRITHSCKNCDYERSEEITSHQLVNSESIDLSQFGSVCGGFATLYSCACGEYNDLSIEDSLCEFEQQYDSVWIEDAIRGEQYTAEHCWGFDFGGSAYVYVCPVTDPERCAYKIRYASYWIKDENACRAYRYETWQLGYDSDSGECVREITFKTGEWKTYHNYEYTETDIGENYDCLDCGSYYYDRTYRDSEDRVYKTQILAHNTLDDGCAKEYERIYEYGYYGENGYEYTKLDYTKTVYADGREEWYSTERTKEDYVGAFGEGGYKEETVNSGSSRNRTESSRAVVYYKGYEFEIYNYYYESERYWYRYDYAYSFDGSCKRTVIYENQNGKNPPITEDYHVSSIYALIKEPSCTQEGVYGFKCPICDCVTGPTATNPPQDHSWVQVTSDWYYCSRCGLENANGVSGSVIMEDFTARYGNGESYVVGYYSKTGVEFIYFVSLVLANGEEVVLEGVSFTNLTDVRAISFSIAEVRALAEELGYTDSTAYDVKISFVPYGSDGSFDYAVTFADPTVDSVGVITGDAYFVEYLGIEGASYEISPAEDGEWTFFFMNRYSSVSAYLYDVDGNELTGRYGGGYSDFSFTYQLEAGKTYTVVVQNSSSAIYMPVRFTVSKN